jgi:hypothetical protein
MMPVKANLLINGYVLASSTGAVTLSTITGTRNDLPYMMRLVNGSTSQMIAYAQIVSQADTLPLRGQSVCLSGVVTREVGSTLFRYAILAWNGTADACRLDVVNNWASHTFTPNNFFISTVTVVAVASHAVTTSRARSTPTRLNFITGVVPSDANNLIVIAWTNSAVAAHTGTLDLVLQLESEPVEPPPPPALQIAGVGIVNIVSVGDTEVTLKLADGRLATMPVDHPLMSYIMASDSGITTVVLTNQVDAERDRRLQSMTFGGHAYQCDPFSQQQVSAAGLAAQIAIIGGATPGNMRWANPNADFGWITSDNVIVPMDAPTMVAFYRAVTHWVMGHMFAARALKDMSPIPLNYADNGYWPQ